MIDKNHNAWVLRKNAYFWIYLKQVHFFQTVFKTFFKDKEKIVNALQLSYSNAQLEATNNLI